MTTFAVIPAAGKSSRMGRPKLSLPLGDSTVLELVIGALRNGGADHILVVVGPHVPELVPLAEAAGARTLLLDHETPDMRATVEAGLRWLEEQFSPNPNDAWFLVPADHPALDSTLIRRLLQTRSAQTNCSIVLPAYAGKRGHPALLDWNHVGGLRTFEAGQGLNVFLRQHRDETVELLVDSPSVLLDLDTPEDYEKLQQSWAAQPPRRSLFFSWKANLQRMIAMLWATGCGALLGYFLWPRGLIHNGHGLGPVVGGLAGLLLSRWVLRVVEGMMTVPPSRDE